MRNLSDKWRIILLIVLSIMLVGCGSNEKINISEDASQEEVQPLTMAVDDEPLKKSFTIAMVADTGGIKDKSFNQSAWKGLVTWGEEHGLNKGIDGYDYLISENDIDYLPNFTQLVKDDFNLIFGVGFLLEDALEEIAIQYPNTYFGMIDTVVDAPNVASITFSEHDGSFLVGVAAAMKSKSNKIGFIGGVDSPTIQKFEAGFIAGVKSINPKIDVQVEYAADFNAKEKGKTIALDMYERGIDIIYHAAGETGNGVIEAAKEFRVKENGKEIWVIGVDRDQYEEGLLEEENLSIVLTSMVKRVDFAVHKVSNLALENRFPGGQVLVFGLENDGISVADTNKIAFSDEIKEAVETWKKKITTGEIIVPQTRKQLENYVLTNK